jgi:phosphatidylglycerol lysyltransferase
LIAFCALLAPFREVFSRRSRLSYIQVTPGWLLSAVAVVVGAAVVGWWSFAHADYADQQFWQALADEDVTRAIRSSAGAAILLLAYGVWRLVVTPAAPLVTTTMPRAS